MEVGTGLAVFGACITLAASIIRMPSLWGKTSYVPVDVCGALHGSIVQRVDRMETTLADLRHDLKEDMKELKSLVLNGRSKQ